MFPFFWDHVVGMSGVCMCRDGSGAVGLVDMLDVEKGIRRFSMQQKVMQAVIQEVPKH